MGNAVGAEIEGVDEPGAEAKAVGAEANGVIGELIGVEKPELARAERSPEAGANAATATTSPRELCSRMIFHAHDSRIPID